MWGIIARIAGWAGQAALGWMVGDAINEAATTKQVTAAGGTAVTSPISTVTNTVFKLLPLAAVIVGGWWVLKKFGILKK